MPCPTVVEPEGTTRTHDVENYQVFQVSAWNRRYTANHMWLIVVPSAVVQRRVLPDHRVCCGANLRNFWIHHVDWGYN